MHLASKGVSVVQKFKCLFQVCVVRAGAYLYCMRANACFVVLVLHACHSTSHIFCKHRSKEYVDNVAHLGRRS